MLRLAIFLSLLSVGTVDFVNDWDCSFIFQCKLHQRISHLYSIHDNHKEDRRWNLGCSPLPLPDASAEDCYWTKHVNQFDAPIDFQCPDNEFIAGMASEHNNYREDRLFQFYCCDTKGAKLHDCSSTEWVNDWDGVMDYTVPSDQVLTGVYSEHSNHREDRRFDFQLCNVSYYSD